MINIKRVKQGASITFYNGVYMIMLGIFFLGFISFNMRALLGSLLQSWGFFQRYSPEIAHFFVLFNIIIGILLISCGIFISYMSDFLFKRKEIMTWVILFIAGIIAWGGVLTISIFHGNYILITLTFIGWIMFVLGILLPIKFYLEKNYKEY